MEQVAKKTISISFIIIAVVIMLGSLYFYKETIKTNEAKIDSINQGIEFLERAKIEAKNRLNKKIQDIENISDSNNIDDISDELDIDIDIDLSELDDLYDALNLGEFSL